MALAQEQAAEADIVPANDAADERQSLLRFITCGSVDDGKSTLIGRLLFEAGAIPDDVLATLAQDSARLGNASGGLDYSLLVDGLQAEREQGITIDVAYRYFSTPRRSFIVADTPGHEQYTRNMATGASGTELAIILIDAEKGVLPQTRRHSLIVSLVGVRHVVVAINKIDLVGHDERVVRAIEAQYRTVAANLGFETVTFIPVSARDGDNIATRSPNTPWHDGPTLLGWLESVRTQAVGATADFVLPVQWVNRPDSGFRGFSGTVAAGAIRPGEAVLALPSGLRANVSRIVTFDGDLDAAQAGQAITVVLDRELDIARGDVLVAARQPRPAEPAAREEADVHLLVTADRTIAPGDAFVVRLGTASATARVEAVSHAIDIEGHGTRQTEGLSRNDLGHVRLRFDRPLPLASYATVRELGSLILIDRLTNATAAMGVVVRKPGTGDAGSVLSFRRVADRTLSGALGPEWRREIAPAASWRIGSALLVGAIVALATDSMALGLGVAALDAVLRTGLRLAHRNLWLSARRRRMAQHPDAVSDGGGI